MTAHTFARRTFAFTAILLLAPLAHAAKTCTPQKFGAKADGTTPDTAAIQKAIDTCSQSKTEIEFAAGTYLSAPLTLRSHTHIKLDEGAKLIATQNVDDYPVRTEKGNTWRRTALIHSDNVDDVSITGKGTIDGSGKLWWDMAHTHRVPGDTTGSGVGFTRPLLIDLVNTTHIAFDGITVQNSPMYNFTFFGSSYITITNVKIINPLSPNTDGIDPFWSSHIKIDHVSWDTGDDCVAIKSGLVERGEPDLPSFDISITNSECDHGHGISIGSELAGGAHDITMDNLTFNGTDAGIRIKSNRTRGNDIYNLHYSNIKMTNVKTPIEISAYYPERNTPKTDTAQPLVEHTPKFRNITIKNVTATGATNLFWIAGLPEAPIKGISMENVSLQGAKGGYIQQADITEKNVTIKSDTPVDQREGVNIKVLP